MGALHAGHEAVIGAALAAGRPVVVSIFVNPLSFGSNENFAGYPRSPQEDLELCARLGVDAVFMPTAEDVYPRGYSTYVTEETVSKPLCGRSRPAHFRGVTTLVAKLLNIVAPTHVFVGQKDAQHVAVVVMIGHQHVLILAFQHGGGLVKMVADLNYSVDLVVVLTVRDPDGLAVAVRNRELTSALRQEAAAINLALKRAKEMVDSGVRSSDRLVAEVTHILGAHYRLRIIYASVVDPATMQAMREVVPGRTLLCIAAWLDEVRLTDNALL